MLTIHILSEVLSYTKTRTPEYYNTEFKLKRKRRIFYNYLHLFTFSNYTNSVFKLKSWWNPESYEFRISNKNVYYSMCHLILPSLAKTSKLFIFFSHFPSGVSPWGFFFWWGGERGLDFCICLDKPLKII